MDNEFNKITPDTNIINTEIAKYIKEYQTNPLFMQDYQDFINNVPGAKNKLQQYLNHQKSVMQMQTNNIKMKMDILVKGKSAYERADDFAKLNYLLQYLREDYDPETSPFPQSGDTPTFHATSKPAKPVNTDTEKRIRIA